MLRADAIAEVDDADEVGTLLAVLEYSVGHQLHVRLLFDVKPGHPVWLRYVFHLQDRDGRSVFRYDNESHYPEMTTFPHHKHVGADETPVESAQPTLHQIVTETIEVIQRAER